MPALPTTSAPTGGDFTLQSATGPVTLKDYRGKVVLLYFGYTYCPDICPTSLTATAQALGQLAPAELARVQTLFVSVDPERDTPARLKDYGAFFHPSIIGVTGTAAANRRCRPALRRQLRQAATRRRGQLRRRPLGADLRRRPRRPAGRQPAACRAAGTGGRRDPQRWLSPIQPRSIAMNRLTCLPRSSLAVLSASTLVPTLVPWLLPPAPPTASPWSIPMSARRPPAPWPRAPSWCIKNTGAKDVKVVKADNPASKLTELHTHINDGGVMKMRPVKDIPIKAKGEDRAQARRPARDADRDEGAAEGRRHRSRITLTFDDGSSKKVDAPVRKPTAGDMPPLAPPAWAAACPWAATI